MALLKTVRAKLTMLVGLSAAATLSTLPVLNWAMSRQLVDVVDDRVPDAVRGFDLELGDDVKDLETATLTLADSDDVTKALANNDAVAARAELEVFQKAYPGMGLIVMAQDARPIAEAGLTSFHVPKSLAEVPANFGTDARYFMRKGCSGANDGRPGYASIRRVRGGGFVAACVAIDEGYLANSAGKLGLELAIRDEKGEAKVHTPGFPSSAFTTWPESGEPLVENGGRLWAFKPFAPAIIPEEKQRFSVIAALDVTRIRSVVRQDLLLTMAVLVFAAAVAIIFGARVASKMSKALGRVNSALKKLEQSEYVHVVPLGTGDEMEDLASGFNTMVDGLRERDKLRTTFGKYMTEAVVEHLMKGKVELGGKSLPVTILFTDIRSFTTISETMEAQELVALLNEYFTAMVSIVMEEGGVVDKYIGDAIMAVFGAPVPKPDDAVRAVRAAVRMRHELVELNVRLAARGKPALKTGIGIHTGEVVAGNIGSEARMEYTVIGDAVNLASRLEGATKDLGVNVLISEDTQLLLDGEFETRAIKEINVKGRAKPVMTYEVVGTRRADSLETETHKA